MKGSLAARPKDERRMLDPTYLHSLFHPNSVAGDNIFAWLGFGLARREYAAMLACPPSSLAKRLHSGSPP
jgi:hypothetical protein